ncbi:beta-ketoacyl synthase N-terminal-like domain-containing protein [Noviherbaspirillum sp.]|jgi:acyl transferase domain-containing protein/thioesterase domain-containing protein|uniref:type I polyketide synthase n=1 Tax=Noviherbaspirillum sp. TaxID=1926288 RepID=UPI0025F1E8A0|nr:beta-ketoacyl synthase N-terminal-like domain-containing protein [Noviherbaspirillum sp.]
MDEPQRDGEANDALIAVIGMAGRFPGAPDIATFWKNLRNGVESIRFFSDDELRESGIDPEERDAPNYVKASPMLDGATLFDAEYFGYSPKEAELMDPQHRIFLECAMTALESAGCNPALFHGHIGVFGGAGTNVYQIPLIASQLKQLRASSALQLLFMQGNDCDFLTTRVSYKLKLRGPSVTVQTACSSSLVAVHLACQSLLSGESDIVLAGGVSIARSYSKSGYFFEGGGIVSRDGHCRAFDAAADGTVFGDGAGVVVLKRLNEALSDGDNIRAVIRGTAINNDGAQKPGYAAPSVDGQAAVIAEALAVAGVDADTVAYIEAHGTGTALGDPIEIAALTQCFRRQTSRRGFCAIGSVKSNIGHLNTASGIAGLIKTVLALEYGEIPPTLHFKSPNPRIDFASSPFFVNASLRPWPHAPWPRRAGVSSFGIGGTNAHVVLEEAPRKNSRPSSHPVHLLMLSARTAGALETATQNLAQHLRDNPQLELADVAHTLATGRAWDKFARAIVCSTIGDAVDAMQTLDSARVVSALRKPRESVVFMFPGQGAQRVHMGSALYRAEPVFRSAMDLCADILMRHHGLDLLGVLFPPEGGHDNAARRLKETELAQPAVFSFCYALAQLWMAKGLRPEAMIGHSLGELVAACVAGVFSLADGLKIVVVRARLMQALPRGAMLAVPLPLSELQGLLTDELSLAAVNAPSNCVVSGPDAAVTAFEAELSAKGLASMRLHTSHAFHSRMMAPAVTPFVKMLRGVRLRTPEIPFVSNVSGDWITDAQACDPEYWGRHLLGTVQFAQGVRTVLDKTNGMLLEVGPGHTLEALARQNIPPQEIRITVASLPVAGEAEAEFVMHAMARLWSAGVDIDASALYGDERRVKVHLPGYPFERRQYWFATEATPKRDPAMLLHASAPDAKNMAPATTRPSAGRAAIRRPATDLEQSIAAVWSEALNVADIGLDDDFVALGGHSLLALQLMPRMRQACGIDLPLSILFEARTVQSLAKHIEAARRTSTRNDVSERAASDGMVLLQQGSSTPLFLLHPIGGGLRCYDSLVAMLDRDQTVYGFHAFGDGMSDAGHATIDDLALRYLSAIRRVQTVGPYQLAGWSFGGLLAFRIAQLLDEQAESVSLLMLIDAHLPDRSSRPAPPEPEEVWEIFVKYLPQEMAGSEFDANLLPASGDGERFAVLAELLRTGAVAPGGRMPAATELARMYSVFQRNYVALWSFEPRPFAGKAIFFKAIDTEAAPSGWQAPWPELVRGGCDIVQVNGDHFSILRPPGIEDIATRLRRSLVKAAATNAAEDDSLRPKCDQLLRGDVT